MSKRSITRIISLPSKLLYYYDVLEPKHLVQEEIELDISHLPAHSSELTKPDITLLSHRGVESPCLVIVPHLRKISRITVLLTELVRNGMLVEEMPHINTEFDLVEEGIVPLEYLL